MTMTKKFDAIDHLNHNVRREGDYILRLDRYTPGIYVAAEWDAAMVAIAEMPSPPDWEIAATITLDRLVSPAWTPFTRLSSTPPKCGGEHGAARFNGLPMLPGVDADTARRWVKELAAAV